ncbi:hypothetical protein HJC23_000163 [Cyclotella cryptica]|uniref:Lipoprotein n=1 Tax=Cyclotella cryptica TaxID=29204 RepID=A0ABD3QCY3_9STRA|eukprot:CCRYP_006337-RA/>CCRYP_006337-RA protein AED:0.39 eAED:0.39 QI:45/1/1/1/0/0.5/2/458/268
MREIHFRLLRKLHRAIFPLLTILTLQCCNTFSWSNHNQWRGQEVLHAQKELYGELSSTTHKTSIQRREFAFDILIATSTINVAQWSYTSQPATAYTPDSDPLRESLYLMSRVQEATVQQERFVNRATSQDALKNKMKLTLRLVEKNYRLLDQITFASEYITPQDKVVDATAAGYEAAEALQNAIDYVNNELRTGPFEKGQKEYLAENLQECRERLFDFLSYMPQEKLEEARKRVEEENVLNRDEFDGDADAGVYNPVVLPWKNRGEKA